MAPVSKPPVAAPWVRRPSRFNEEGGSAEGSSSGEDTRPLRSLLRQQRADSVAETRRSDTRKTSRTNPPEMKKRPPSFAMSDTGSSVNGRSYVDPWDMENYSFLRRQLEEVSISDNDVSSTPALESTQSDFYYVPLDGDGSPQYQYKQYVDANGLREEQRRSPVVFRDDTCGRVAGIDEHHFYNDYLDPHQHQLYGSYEPAVVNKNPSRQSERSRYNNQDYHLYTPPSIIKSNPSEKKYNSRATLERNYRTQRPRNKSYSDVNLTRDIYSRCDDRSLVWTETLENRRKSFSDVKAVSRRQSFQEPIYSEDRRRRSAVDVVYDERRVRGQRDKISRRKSIHEIAGGQPSPSSSGKTSRRLSRRHLANTQSVDDLVKEPAEEVRVSSWGPSAQPDSLVYVYETARRRRKMVLPNTDIYNGSYRVAESDSDETIPTIQSETYSMRPLGLYTMTNYGHLKIDYSCSWKNLHRYITDKIRG